LHDAPTGTPAAPAWELATDAETVHALLCACDHHTATPEAPAPTRSFETTAARVRDGSVHVLRRDGEVVAMFTLTWTPPFDAEPDVFPPARKPAYISRLAVRPDHLAQGSVLGAQCLRHAAEVAAAQGADAIRSEANPDLRETLALLGLFGFTEHASRRDPDGRGRVYLQRRL
jgi:GNAT superfamily N-acetyltransferase